MPVSDDRVSNRFPFLRGNPGTLLRQCRWPARALAREGEGRS